MRRRRPYTRGAGRKFRGKGGEKGPVFIGDARAVKRGWACVSMTASAEGAGERGGHLMQREGAVCGGEGALHSPPQARARGGERRARTKRLPRRRSARQPRRNRRAARREKGRLRLARGGGRFEHVRADVAEAGTRGSRETPRRCKAAAGKQQRIKGKLA